MKRKILPGKNPLCVCGHRLISHYHNEKFSAGYGGCKVKDLTLRQKFGSKYCSCEKFFDRRHCKIKSYDPVLLVLKRHIKHLHQNESFWYDYVELTKLSHVSRATVSRRCNLFMLLGLVVREWGMGFFTDVMNFKLNWLIYDHLKKEGIIVS